MTDTIFFHRFDELTDFTANLQKHGLSLEQAELIATAIDSVRDTADAALRAATRDPDDDASPDAYRQEPFDHDAPRPWSFRRGEAETRFRFDPGEVAVIAIAAAFVSAMAMSLLGAG